MDQQSDLWALGATLYEMLAGAPPYQAEDTRKLEAADPLQAAAARPAGLRARAACAPSCAKALAPDPRKRYRSAARLSGGPAGVSGTPPTVAETEQRVAWGANATIEAARACLRKATATMRRAKRRLRVAGAVAWFAAGMVLWIGGSLGWQVWQTSAAPKPEPVKPAPPVLLTPALYTAEADRVLDAYAASVDPSLDAFDWQKAEICLVRAVNLGDTGDRTLERLALSRGYATLERLSGAAVLRRTR